MISVVVTCYNSEKTLSRCLDSIINQSINDIEIIVVNDGSDGDFDTVISSYINRVKIVKNEQNLGLFLSRIRGSQQATGEYIAFCDADDTVSYDFYRTLGNKAIESSSDIVIGDLACIYQDGRCEYFNNDPILNQDILLTGESCFHLFMEQQGLFYGYYVVWNKIYSIKLWNKCINEFIKFSKDSNNLTMTEDIAFSNLLWIKSKKVCNCHNVFYYYHQHENQSVKKIDTHDMFFDRLKDVAKVFNFFEKNLKKYDLFDKYMSCFFEWKKLFLRYWFDNAVKNGFKNDYEKNIKQLFGICELQHTTELDYYFYSMKTELFPHFNWIENIKRLICNPDIKIVSFDIFDTLLYRPFLRPDDIFHILSVYFNEIIDASVFIDFHKIRCDAEHNVRQRISDEYGCEDINIHEIYDYIGKQYNIKEEYINLLKNKEIELELKFLRKNTICFDLYLLAKEKNKKIIVISDMYICKNDIQHMLKCNNYDRIDNIYISSELRVLKSTGNLYKYVLNELKVPPQSIVHIGDNWISDIENAKKFSLNVGHIPNAAERLMCENKGWYSGNMFTNVCDNIHHMVNFEKSYDNFVGIRAMLGLIANKCFKIPYAFGSSPINNNPYMFGYYILGMHLYAVADWIKNKAQGNTVHFIARDGYLPKKAYDILTDNKYTSNYIYLSRKAILPFLLYNKNNILSLSNFINYTNYTPEKFFNLFKVSKLSKDKINFYEFCYNNKYIPNKKFKNIHAFNSFITLFYDNILDKNKISMYINAAKKYFKNIIKNNDYMFDLGYSCRNEEIFSNIFDIKVNGLYIHINTDQALQRKKFSNLSLDTFYDYPPLMYVLLREHCFCEFSGSCCGYSLEENKFTAKFNDFEYNFQEKYITSQIQNGALQFVKDFKDTFGLYSDKLFYQKEAASILFEYFMHYPSDSDIKMFAPISFDDELWGGEKLSLSEIWKEWIEKFKLNRYSIADDNIKLYKKENEQLKNKILTLHNDIDEMWYALSDSQKDKTPRYFNEELYIKNNPDVREAIKNGTVPSAFYHYVNFGKKEGRKTW